MEININFNGWQSVKEEEMRAAADFNLLLNQR
jgi:hypothetical protein